MTFLQTHRNFFIGLLFTSIGLLIFLIFALLHWPGENHFCVAMDHCYCETIQWDSMVRQPVNTWSNLLCVVVGLYILWEIDRYPKNARTNPMLSASFYSISFGILVIFIGIGSMFFHGGMVNYGGLIDNISMNTFVTFLICYNGTRLMPRSEKKWFLFYILINIGCGILSILPDVGRNLFGYIVAIVIIFELSLWWAAQHKKIGFSRNWWLLILSMVTFGLAFLSWTLSKTGAIFCYPESIWQGHGLWHFLVAIACYFIFRYLQSEKPISNK
jgi:hypothetical protein